MYELDNDNIRILEVRILKHREIKQIAQDHLPNKSVRIWTQAICPPALFLKY